MSILFFPRTAGTATPSTGPRFPEVPVLQVRVAWRDEGFTKVAYDGASTASWVIDGSAISGPASSLSTTSSDSFGGGESLQMVTGGTAESGVDFPVDGTATAGRTYRFRVGLRPISGSTSTAIRVGNASDFAASTATLSSGWAWQTVDWTPGTAVSDAYVSIQNGEAATQTTGIDHPEVYESFDEVSIDALRVTRGSRYDGGRESPGTVRLSIIDGDDTYTPRNTASDLYGLVEPGRELHVRATYGGRLYPIAYGVIETVEPDPDTKKVRIEAKDGLGQLEHYSISRPFGTDTSYATARAAVLADEALAAEQHDLTEHGIESSSFADGTDASTGVLDYLENLNEATGTLHVCAPSVSARYPWKYKTIDRATLTSNDAGRTISDDFQRLTDVDLRDESLLTRQRVSWVGYEYLPSQTVVEADEDLPYWQYSDEDYGSSDRPQPEAIYRVKRIRGRKRRRRKVRRRIGTKWVDSVVPIELEDGESKDTSVDFSVPIEDMSLSVTDTSGFVSATTTIGPALIDITLTASGGSDTVTDMSVTGKPRIPLDEQEETVTNGSVIHEGRPIDNETILSEGYATGLATYITWRYGDSRLRPEVVDQHHPVRQVATDVGSHLTVTASRWYISAVPFVVRTLEHDVTRGGAEWETTYGLEELPSGGNWFTLGISDLDGSAVLAY